jgi:ATP-dependent Zn protease
MIDINESRIPLYSIFILILVISSAYVTSLIPRKIHDILENNIYMKHFLCLLTLIFFVVITTEPLQNKSLSEIIKKSIILYLIFLLLIKNDYHFFTVNIVLLGILYLISIKKSHLVNSLKNEKNKDNIKKIEKEINYINYIDNILFIVIIILIIIGLLIYFQKKRNQYKNKFNYITFLFGKIKK